jgi:hypothetical protein
MVDDVALLLGISNDSAYRRIRGDKALSLQEAVALMDKYSISLDDFAGSDKGTVTFRASFLDTKEYPFSQWLKQLLEFTEGAGANPETEVIFILNELSIFQLIQFPELCAFKLFFWQKSNLGFEELRESKFSLGHCDEASSNLCKEIAMRYVKIKTSEFTTAECLNSFLKQILFYNEAGYFESPGDARGLCHSLHRLVDHFCKQAELGYKFIYGGNEAGQAGNFDLYHNDIILADNTVLIRTGDTGTSFITSNAINLMQSQNADFFKYNYRWGQNLRTRSVLISGTAERERNRFFRNLHHQVDRVEEKLS